MKRFKAIITIVSLIFIFVTKIEMDFWNFFADKAALSSINEIVYDIAVCIFSAMILVWGIDEINEKNRIREEEKRKQIVYRKIIPVIKEYYEFYIKLYIATRKDKVVEGDKVLKTLFYDVDNYIEQIKSANLFYKEGFYFDGSIDFLEYIKDHKEPPKSLPWYKCWNIDNKNFTTKMRQIEQDFSYMLPADLLNKIVVLLNLAEPINNISNFIEIRPLIDIKKTEEAMPSKFFIDAYRLKYVLNALEDLMNYISINSGEDILKIDIKYINERNVSPLIGDALK